MRARVLAITAAVWVCAFGQAVGADSTQVERGKYLVRITGCGDCHTPGHFLGKPDHSKALAGSDVGFFIPDLGTFVAPNLTSDKETGLGNWTAAQITTAVRSGARPDGRLLAAVMPYAAYAGMTSEDVAAVVAYLQSLAPIRNKVPGPFTAKQSPTVLTLQVIPPKALPKDLAAR